MRPCRTPFVMGKISSLSITPPPQVEPLEHRRLLSAVPHPVANFVGKYADTCEVQFSQPNLGGISGSPVRDDLTLNLSRQKAGGVVSGAYQR